MRLAARPPAWVGPWIGVRYDADAKPKSLEEAHRIGAYCWSFFALAIRSQFGVSIDEYDGPLYHGRRTAREVGEAADAFAQRFRKIEDGAEQAGDAILLRMTGVPIHIGLVVAPGLMLHIEEGCDSAWERYRDRTWKDRIVAFHRAEPA
jgi:cell wall-associated NlpC family hydrolase